MESGHSTWLSALQGAVPAHHVWENFQPAAGPVPHRLERALAVAFVLEFMRDGVMPAGLIAGRISPEAVSYACAFASWLVDARGPEVAQARSPGGWRGNRGASFRQGRRAQRALTGTRKVRSQAGIDGSVLPVDPMPALAGVRGRDAGRSIPDGAGPSCCPAGLDAGSGGLPNLSIISRTGKVPPRSAQYNVYYVK